MKSRRKTLPADYNVLEVSQKTPWRQMTITESFRNSKPNPFKMEKPVVITNVCHVIDSDSDAETPPQFEFKGARTVLKNEPETFQASTMDALSPPKRAKTMIGVFRPNNSTPKGSLNNNISPKTPDISSVGSPSLCFNGPVIIDSSPNIGSNSSNNTITYEYDPGPSSSNFWDEDTEPFPPDAGMTLTSAINSEEKLIMNYEENSMDIISLPVNDNENILPNIMESNATKLAVAKRLDFNNALDSNNPTGKVETKRKISNKNKTTETINQRQKSKNNKNNTDVNNTSKKTRKRKNKSPVKGSSPPKQSNTGGKDIRSITPPRVPLIRTGPTSVTAQTPIITLPTGTDGKSVEMIPGTIRKQPVKQNTKEKCQNFLATLIELSRREPRVVAIKVRTLIQALIDNEIVPERFCARLERLLKARPQPFLIGFLKKSLPLLQHSLATNELAIDGIRPPSSRVIVSLTGTSSTVRPVTQMSPGTIRVVGPASEVVRASKSPEAVLQNRLVSPGVPVVKQPKNDSLPLLRATNEMAIHGMRPPANEVLSIGGASPVVETARSATEIACDQNPVNQEVAKKKDHLNGIIDKLLTNKEQSANPLDNNLEVPQNERNNCTLQNNATNTLQKEKNCDVPRNSQKKDVEVATVVTKVLSPTGWIGKSTIASNTSSPRSSSKRNQASNSSSSKVIEKKLPSESPSQVTETQNNLPIQSKTDTSGTVELEKTPRKNLKPIKIASAKQDTANKTSAEASASVSSHQPRPEASATRADPSTNSNTSNYSTPQKQKMGPNTPSKNGSPKKRLFRSASTDSSKKVVSPSPNKGSPSKNREIKSLKSKDGKELQVRQMDELVKLFRHVTANRHLRTLLNKSEYDILRRFVLMEDNKKYCLMKLFVWQRVWYNIFNFCSKAKICEDEKEIIDIFEYLREEELVDTDYKSSSNLVELLNRLDVKKVKEIMEERKIKPIGNKEENIKTILKVACRQTTLTSISFKDLILQSIEKKMGFAIKIKEDVCNAFYHAYLLATFTNPAFYKVADYFNNIVHLKVVFPETTVEDYPVFYSREKFLNYGRALKMRAELDDQLTNKNRESKIMGLRHIAQEAYSQLDMLSTEDTHEHSEAPHLKRFTAEHVYIGILSSCCEKMFTKNGHPSEVKKWLEYLIKRFPNSRRLGKWYEVLIKVHMRYLDNISYESAAGLLIDALDTKKHLLSDMAKYNLREIGLRLKSSRRHKIDQIYHDRIIKIIPRPFENFPEVQIDSPCIRSEDAGRKRGYYLKNREGMTVRGVEQVALEHYANDGYPEGEHCEGSLVKALLILLFWDIIYNPTKVIPGTFISELQTVPLDLFTSYFYEKRRELIDKRLAEIGSEWCEDKVINFARGKWQEHSHERSVYGTIMDTIKDEHMVEELISVIGCNVLAKIFERILKNIRGFSSGMPDLLVWNVEKKESKFVEVKGEGDKLSTTQKLWLQHLKQSGALVEVCHVHSMGSKRKKIKKVLTANVPGPDEAGPSSRPDD